MKTLKILLLLPLLAFFSCSKDETTPTLTGIEGGIVSRFQMVTVEVGNSALANETYTGTFNNETITLAKVDDNKLLFYVKETTPLGKVQLHIPTLDETKIVYEVKEATLSESPSATLQPLVNFQTQYASTLTNNSEDAPFIQNHNSFNQYIVSLSGDDQIKAAKFYKTNKAIFDAVYLTNYDNVQGKYTTQSDADFNFQLYRSLILRHKLAVAVTIIAGTLAVTPPYDPIETSLSAAVAVAGIHKASDFHKQIIADVFKVVQVKLNDNLGTNNRMAYTTYSTNATLSLTDNQMATLPFSVNARNITNADSGVQKEFVQTYFTAKNKLNTFINQINTTINWLNTNVPLLSLSTINTVDVPSATTLNSFDTTTHLMLRFTFTVNHPNLTLETASLSDTGQLNLKVKFTGNPSSTTINSSLNYTYNDDFSSFSGSFPIEVNNQDPCTLGTMTAPVITGVNWECNSTNSIAVLISFTANGTGILPNGGSGYCDPTQLCYPVRLYFKGPGQDWSIGANGYVASLKSGTVNQGVVEITFTSNSSCIPGLGAYESFVQHWASYNYQWKVELMNQCNQRSNQVDL